MKAEVKVSVTPHELQIIVDALKLYLAEMSNQERPDAGFKHTLTVYGSHADCVRNAKTLIVSIGMK